MVGECFLTSLFLGDGSIDRALNALCDLYL